MLRLRRLLVALMILGVGVLDFAGCGVTRSTDTVRTATEQLLISDAIDRAVQTMNLQTLSGQTVFLDDSKLGDTVDRNYYISTLRQQLLANGCELRDQKDQADFVVEARAGAIGTDRNDLLFGIPSMNVPMIPLVQPVPSAIPEIPIAKRKDQRGVAKIAVFAYHRASGTPVWQSGIVRQESSANDVWILGAGPFQRGTIYEGTAFAGTNLKNEPSKDEPKPQRLPAVSVASENLFTPPQRFAKQTPAAAEQKVVQAAHSEPATAASPKSAATPAKPVAASQAAAQPTPTQTPAPTQPASAPANATTTSPTSNGLSTNVPMPDPQVIKSTYVRVGDTNPLPQPRFNSPQ
jgi:hypothetical protein